MRWLTVALTALIGVVGVVLVWAGGSSYTALEIQDDAGTITLGAALDTNLYRASASTLQTDDNLVVGEALTVTGTTNLNGVLNANANEVVTGTLYVSGTTQLHGTVYGLQSAGQTGLLYNGYTGRISLSTAITFPSLSTSQAFYCVPMSGQIFYGDNTFGWGGGGPNYYYSSATTTITSVTATLGSSSAACADNMMLRVPVTGYYLITGSLNVGGCSNTASGSWRALSIGWYDVGSGNVLQYGASNSAPIGGFAALAVSDVTYLNAGSNVGLIWRSDCPGSSTTQDGTNGGSPAQRHGSLTFSFLGTQT